METTEEDEAEVDEEETVIEANEIDEVDEEIEEEKPKKGKKKSSE